MADFQTHITTSTVLGIAGGLAANAFYDVPLPSCLLAGGLCSLAGMLPDLDSDSGVPLRESIAFAAAVLPLMLIERFAKYGLGIETTILCGAILYLFVRFGLAETLKRYTLHRGMFHSIPAAIIAAEITFLIFGNENVSYRFLNAGAVFVGFMSHLLLDEMWSIDMNWGLVKVKSSFGSAMKFWGDNAGANLTAYSLLILFTFLMTRDNAWSDTVEPWMSGRPRMALSKPSMIQDSSSAWRYNLLHNQYKGIPVTSADHPLHQQWVQLYSEYMQLRQMLEQQGLQPNTTYYAPASYQQPPQYYQPPVVPSQLPPAGSQSAPSYQYAPQAYYPPQNNWTGSMLAPHDPYASPTIYDLPKQYGDTQVPPWLSQQTRQPDSFESRAPSLQTGLGSSYRSRNWSLSQPLPNYSQPSYQGSSSYGSERTSDYPSLRAPSNYLQQQMPSYPQTTTPTNWPATQRQATSIYPGTTNVDYQPQTSYSSNYGQGYQLPGYGSQLPPASSDVPSLDRFPALGR